MDGERISLRLEREDLEFIDRFIEGSEEISNRSQLARIAIRSYIEGVSSQPSQGADNRISIIVPRPAIQIDGRSHRELCA
jgi:metal-responsive CopG/Arc/MetJ family transcriptional regulator